MPVPDEPDSEFRTLAAKLSVIPKFPGWSEPAMETVTETLEKWCPVFADAEKLVSEAIDTLTEWTGVAGLRAIHERMRGDVWKPPPVYDPGPGGAPGCKQCMGTGALIAQTDGRYRASVCPCSKTDQSAIRHVAALNQANDDMRRLRQRAEMKHRVPRTAPQKPQDAPPPGKPVSALEMLLEANRKPPVQAQSQREPGDESEWDEVPPGSGRVQ